MKAIVCEMCSSNNIIKKDGVFECQNCGTRYSVEEAKKLLIEGTVDVSGSTVKIDNADELSNLYKVARRAKDDNDRETAAKYYDMIMSKDPNSWEAVYYSVYYRSFNTKLANSLNATYSVKQVQRSVFLLIRDNVPNEEKYRAVKEVRDKSLKFAEEFAKWAYDHYNELDSLLKNDSKYSIEMLEKVIAARDVAIDCGDQIDSVFGKDEKIGSLAVNVWKKGIDISKRYISDQNSQRKCISECNRKIAKYENNFELIARKKEQILSLTNTPKRAVKPFLVTGGLLLLHGVLMLVVYLAGESKDKVFLTLFIVCLIAGIFMIVISGIKKKKNEMDEQQRCDEIENLRKEIDKLEKKN